MARRMIDAAGIPIAAQWIDVDASRAQSRVTELREEGCPATFNVMIVHAAAVALAEYPAMGAQLDYEEWRRRLPIAPKIGVAIASSRGLVVPAVAVDPDDLRGTAQRLHDVVEAVRAGAATKELFAGAAFTVTNIGGLGIHGGVPTPNPGQPGIIGVSSIRPMAVVRGTEIVPASVVTLTLTIDHRAVDGITAARFLRRVGDVLEEQ